MYIPFRSVFACPLVLVLFIVDILLQPWIVLSQPLEQSLLYDFYHSTWGWASNCNSGWSTNTTPLCSGSSTAWYGVTCSSGHVTQINLHGCGIRGTLLPQWSSLTGMQTLYLYNNALSGTLPPQWSSLTNMQYLNLFNNAISGTLPPQWSSLTNMLTLAVSANSLIGTLPPQWSSLTNMRYLTVATNSLSGILPQWSSLTNMRSLYLDSNSLSGTLPPQWSALSSSLYCNVNNNCLNASNAVAWWLDGTYRSITPQRTTGCVAIVAHIVSRGTSLSLSSSPSGSETRVVASTSLSDSITTTCSRSSRNGLPSTSFTKSVSVVFTWSRSQSLSATAHLSKTASRAKAHTFSSATFSLSTQTRRQSRSDSPFLHSASVTGKANWEPGFFHSHSSSFNTTVSLTGSSYYSLSEFNETGTQSHSNSSSWSVTVRLPLAIISVDETSLQAATATVSVASTVASLGGGEPSLATLTLSLSVIRCNSNNGAMSADAMAKSLSILSSWGFLGIAFGNLALGFVVVMLHFAVVCVRAYRGSGGILPFKDLIGSVVALSTDNSSLRFPSLSILVVELLLPGSAFGAMAAVMTGDAGSVVGGVVAIACVAATVAVRQAVLLHFMKGRAYVVAYPADVGSECRRLHSSVVHPALLPAVYWEPASVRMAFGGLFQRYHSPRNALYFSGVSLVLSITMSLAAPMAVPFGFCNELTVVAAMLLCGVSVAYVLKRPERCAVDNIITPVMYLILGAMTVLSSFNIDADASRQWLQLLQWICLLLKVLSSAAVTYWERTMTVFLLQHHGEDLSTVDSVMLREVTVEQTEQLLCTAPSVPSTPLGVELAKAEAEVNVDSLQTLQGSAAEENIDWGGNGANGTASVMLDYDYYQDCSSYIKFYGKEGQSE